MPETLVLLHGFACTRHMWDRVAAGLRSQRYLPLALDLPGHGDAPRAQGPITFGGCVAAVLAASPERFALCGYSLGGRIALNVALSAPERVTRLVLVSSTAGLEDAAERAERRRADEQLAVQLEREPFVEFVERWRRQPLFACDPDALDALARAEHLRNRPDALAAVLRGVGTGQMGSLWGLLGELRMPVTVVAGERDAKFTVLGERMVERLRDGELLILPGGHNLALESPAALAALLDRTATEARLRARDPSAI